MGLRDFVEPGRVCFVNFGEDYGKLVVVVDMLDINRVLIDSVDKTMPRVIYPLRRLTLTKLLVKGVLRGCRTGTLRKLAAKQSTAENFKKTPVALKMAQFKRRSELTDFERFKVMVLRKQRRYRSTHPKWEPPVKKVPKKEEPKKEEKAAPAKKVVPPSPKSGGKKKAGKGKKGGKVQE